MSHRRIPPLLRIGIKRTALASHIDAGLAARCLFHVAVLGEPRPGELDLNRWEAETVGTNVQFLVFLGASVVALVLGIAAVLHAGRKR